MAGHNKWSQIKRKKGALDAKRSKIFTKLIKAVTTAAKEGGACPNPKRLPETTVSVDDPEAVRKILRLIDAQEGDDDIQRVYHNLELTESVLAELEE